jgi:hypothetical protein
MDLPQQVEKPMKLSNSYDKIEDIVRNGNVSKKHQSNKSFGNHLNYFENQAKDLHNNNINYPGTIDYESIKENNRKPPEEIKISVDEQAAHIYINIIEAWIDITNLEGKQNLLYNTKRYLQIMREEFFVKEFNIDIFNNNQLNGTLTKAVKISGLISVAIKFLMVDFQYDNGIKTFLKKLFNPITELLVGLSDSFIITPLISSKKTVNQSIIDKIQKVSKMYKSNKSNNDYSNNIEAAINILKQISGYDLFYIVLTLRSDF